MDKNWWLAGIIASGTAYAQEDTEESTPSININTEEESGIMDSIVSGGGLIVLIAALLGGAWFMNWKRSGKKKIVKRFNDYKSEKAAVEHRVVANDEKQAELQVFLQDTELMSEEKEKEINKIVDEAAEKIKEVVAEGDAKKTVERLRRENLWRTK